MTDKRNLNEVAKDFQVDETANRFMPGPHGQEFIKAVEKALEPLQTSVAFDVKSVAEEIHYMEGENTRLMDEEYIAKSKRGLRSIETVLKRVLPIVEAAIRLADAAEKEAQQVKRERAKL